MAFWNSKERTIVKQAKTVDKVLAALQIPTRGTTADQIRGAVALELLGSEYPTIEKYSKAAFVKTQGLEVMEDVRKMLEQEGILTKKALEHKLESKK